VPLKGAPQLIFSNDAFDGKLVVALVWPFAARCVAGLGPDEATAGGSTAVAGLSQSHGVERTPGTLRHLVQQPRCAYHVFVEGLKVVVVAELFPGSDGLLSEDADAPLACGTIGAMPLAATKMAGVETAGDAGMRFTAPYPERSISQ
jgi:hypothetical protein